MPTPQLASILGPQGWCYGGKLRRFVLKLDASAISTPCTTRERASTLFASAYIAATSALLRLNRNRRHSLQIATGFDDSTVRLWEEWRKPNCVIHDFSLEFLRWRYGEHPAMRFEVATMHEGGRVLGRAIISMVEGGRVCEIFDLLVAERGLVRSFVTLLVDYCRSASGARAIRWTLNADHPCQPRLWATGLLRRSSDSQFFILCARASAAAAKIRWAITLADKDI
jgi:hypothetical protein